MEEIKSITTVTGKAEMRTFYGLKEKYNAFFQLSLDLYKLDHVTYQLVVVAPDAGIMHMSKQVRHWEKRWLWELESLGAPPLGSLTPQSHLFSQCLTFV